LRRLVAEVIVHAEPNTRGFSIEAKDDLPNSPATRRSRLVPRGVIKRESATAFPHTTQIRDISSDLPPKALEFGARTKTPL
jgi:hypothetical protein